MTTTEKKQSSRENEDKSYLEIFQTRHTHTQICFFPGKSMYLSVTKENISGPLMFMGFSNKKLQGFKKYENGVEN